MKMIQSGFRRPCLNVLHAIRIAVLTLTILPVSARIASATDVYVIAGQSNGWRMGSLAQGDMPIPGGHKIYYFGMKCVSEPEQTECRVLTGLNPGSMGTGLALQLVRQSDSDIVLVQYCRCGAPLVNPSAISWYPGADPESGQLYQDGLFPKFQKYLDHAKRSIEDKYGLAWNVRGMFWLQGESDVNSVENPQDYEKPLRSLFWRFRRELGQNLPIVCGEIRPLNRGAKMVNQALANLSEQDPRTGLAITSNITMPSRPNQPGDVHFRLSACHEIGKRFSGELARLTSGAKPEDALRESSGPPNIVVIFADDHAQHAISAYGSRMNLTPHIDRLARDGMRFLHSFVANSICGPSRATLLTGLHSHANGQTGNRATFNDRLPTFAKILQANGYDTAVVGKWHLGAEPNGFDYWALKTGSIYNGAFRTADGSEGFEGHATDAITQRSLDWIGSRRDPSRPFMIWISHVAAHRTWTPATRHLANYEGVEIPAPATLFDTYTCRNSGAMTAQMRISKDLFPAYDLKLPVTGNGILDRQASRQLNAMNAAERTAWHAAFDPRNEAFARAGLQGDDLIRWNYQRYIRNYLRSVDGLDDSVGTVRRYLNDNGLSNNTIVIYTSDQGFFLGDHGWYDKRWMYEESLRTPLIVHWPGVTRPGSTSEKMVQNIDLAPTLIEMARQSVPSAMHGTSLLPLLRGEAVSRWRDAIYYHYQMKENPGRTSHLVARHFGIRTQRFKLICYYDLDQWELFDLKSDPEEMNNVYESRQMRDVRDRLTKRLRQLREEFADETGG